MLKLILLLFLIKGIFLIFLIPPWAAPDEPAHVSYPIYLFNEHKLPSSSQPFILKSINESALKQKNNEKELFNRKDTYDPVSANVGSHPPLYYLYLIPFYIISLPFPSYITLILFRFGSILLGAGCLVITYKIAKKIFPKDENLPLLTVFVVSLQPMFSFISSIVNNDIMVVFAFLLFILQMMKVLGKPSFQNLLYAGLISGLAPLVKPQLVICVLLFVGYLSYLGHLGNLKIKIKQIFILVFLSIAPSILWIITKFIQEGSHFTSYAIQNIQSTNSTIWSYPIDFILGKQPIGIFMSFWGFFGWLDTPMPKWIYLLYVAIIGIYFCGWWIERKKINIKNFIFISSVIYCVAIFAFDLQYYLLTGKFAIQGRYLLPILPLFIFYILKGISFLQPIIRKNIYFLTIAIFVLGQFLMFLTIFQKYH